MSAKRCTLCKDVKPIEDFFEREDMPAGRYAWCKTCMEEQGRSPDYPDIKEQGGGVIHPNYKSLLPGYSYE